MLRYFSPIKKGKNRGDATITLILAIILISGVFLTGGILPHMEDETLNKEATSVVQGVRSEDSDGESLIAAAGSSNDSKKTLQMKQLILATVTPTPTGTPIPTPTRTPTPTPNPSSPGWSISIFTQKECIRESTRIVLGELTIAGTLDGYFEVLVNSDDSAKSIFTKDFAPPEGKYTLTLLSTDGFMFNTWTVRLFSGGSLSASGDWSGGLLKSTREFAELSCI